MEADVRFFSSSSDSHGYILLNSKARRRNEKAGRMFRREDKDLGGPLIVFSVRVDVVVVTQ